MKKLIYLLSFLAVTSLLSCEKKTATPATTPVNPNTNPNSGKIFTIAGDGGPATMAEFDHPDGVVVDEVGNIYISDGSNCRIRKVNPSGIITTIAGNGMQGYSGDGGPATIAELHFPCGIAVDGSGNVYVADQWNQCIRKITPGGVISTIAGNGYNFGGSGGYSGDGGAATVAELNTPYGVAVDAADNLYIGDNGNDRIRMVNASGIISTIAGGDTGLGDGGQATAAGLIGPMGVAVDGFGNVFIAEYLRNRIRKVNTSGIITTIAGNGYGTPLAGGYSGDGGVATMGELYNPTDVVVVGSGNVYISDADNYRIRMINPGGVISTFAGNGTGGYTGDGGIATAAEIGFVQGIGVDGMGNIYIADLYVNRIRIVYK